MNDTNDLQLFDEDVDQRLFAPPLAKQQALARAVALRPRPPVQMPTSAVETDSAPAQPDYRAKSYELLQQAAAAQPSDAENASLRDYARKRDQQSQRNFMLGAVLQAQGGSSFSPIGEQVLRQALASQGPEKIGGGVVSGGEFFTDPEVAAQRRATRLETQAKIYESMAQHSDSVEQRRAAAQAAADLRRDLAQNKSSRLQRAGMTPSGETVSFDPSSGDTLVGGKPYTGPVMSQAALDKQAQTVQEALSSMNRLQGLDQLVGKYPNAFGGVASLSQITPQVIASRWQSAKLTPEERQARALVLTEAAQTIHELYGSALSAGESARANTFAPTGLDDPATVIVKLQAAQRWAQSKAGQYGRQVRGAAETRMGGSRGGVPAGAVQRLD